MKYYFIVLSFVLSSLGAFGQDTLQISPYELIDSSFNNLSSINIPSGRLINRILIDPDSCHTNMFHPTSDDTVTTDRMYALFLEKKYISLDTSQVPFYGDVFQSAMNEMTKEEYEDEKTIVPIAIHEFFYERMDSNSPLIERNGIVFNDFGVSSSQAYIKGRTVAFGTLFDYFMDKVFYLLIKDEWIFTDSELERVEVLSDGKWRNIKTNVPFAFIPESSNVQHIEMRIKFKGEKNYFSKIIQVLTPGLEYDNVTKSDFVDNCDEESVKQIGVNKLKYCLIKGCYQEDLSQIDNGNVVDKPFLLVSGYRPPIFDRSRVKLYKTYNGKMNDFLFTLKSMGYDVYLIRFNYSARPFQHGVFESAELLKNFIYEINEKKAEVGSIQENVIMAVSFGQDVTRMALMEMEKDHFEGVTDKHHHSRLNISFDAQFNGANIPLSSQYMAMSTYYHVSPLNLNIILLPSLSLSITSYLHFQSIAKGSLQMLKYNGWANNGEFPQEPHISTNLFPPTHHPLRQNLLNRFDELDRDPGRYNYPMPLSIRNVGVSLGKYNEVNHTEPIFPAPGQPFIDVLGKKALAALYNPNEAFEIFRRKSFFGYFMIPFVFTNQSFAVQQMHAIDGTSGGYLKGFSSVPFVWGLTENFGINNWGPNNKRHTHKTTFSALGIKQNQWSVYSGHINLHELNFMWDKRGYNINQGDIQSSFYGYPNLGHPFYHFDFSPFEAIYCDNQEDPHVDLADAPDSYNVKLTEFLYSEIEPQKLELQNHHYGSEVRADVPYFARRQAVQEVEFCYSKSPKTDIGSVVVEPNGRLFVRSAGAVGTQPLAPPGLPAVPNGVVILDVQNGAVFDWKIDGNYITGCNNVKMNTTTSSNEQEPVERSFTDDEMADRELNNSLTVYPNPFESAVTVQMNNGARVKKIFVYSLSGRELYYNQYDGLNSKVNFIPSIGPGAYLVKVETDKGIFQTKFIKQ